MFNCFLACLLKENRVFASHAPLICAGEHKPIWEGAMLLETRVILVAEGLQGSVQAQGRLGNSQCEMLPWSKHSRQSQNEIILLG